MVVDEVRIVDHKQLKTKGSDKGINCEDAYQELGELFSPVLGLEGRYTITFGYVVGAGTDEPEMVLIEVVGWFGRHG